MEFEVEDVRPDGAESRTDWRILLMCIPKLVGPNMKSANAPPQSSLNVRTLVSFKFGFVGNLIRAMSQADP